MDNPQQLSKRQQEKATVVAWDPHTLISEGKRDLYKGGGAPVSLALEEIVSRFEQTTRAGLGASSPQFAGTGGMQSS